MAKLPNEDFQGFEDDIRHDELMSRLKAIAVRPRVNLEPLLEKNLEAIEAIVQKDNVPDMQPLITQIQEGWAEIVRLLSLRPKSFRIERDSEGLIKRIVAEA